jgi:hypothetical protein
VAVSTEASPPTATVTVTNAVGGLFEAVVEPADSAGLAGTYMFEGEVEDASGDKTTVARGLIVVDGGSV